ncbi:MAG: T9SS type A sorting domain-containing protein, partial [Bacteroidales bacterium]|nr:T9SS type A sorting domain-containing protein [Bacteroidales bacterium]
ANTVFPQTLEVDYIRVYSNIDYLTIEGKQIVISNEDNLEYSIPYMEGAVYNWDIPETITVVQSNDSGQITLNWGETAEILRCEVITSCGTKEIELLVNTTETINEVYNSSRNQNSIIFPNPFTDTFKISDNIQIQSFNISNIAGKTIEKNINPDNQVYSGSLMPGLYFISIEDIKGKLYVEKIIKK